jgi:hypothetical protein
MITPSLDYLHQYPVTHVKEKQDNSGYAIEFEGGAIIGVEGENTSAPDNIEGKALITVIKSVDETRLIFGHTTEKGTVVDQTEVPLPTDYFIIDPRFEGEPFYPNRVQTDSLADTIRSQFEEQASEGFADGPDEPEEDEDTPKAIEG